ncbi:MAG: lipid-A-disaccharide synthase [Candidatus Tyrphobacter sp.]
MTYFLSTGEPSGELSAMLLVRQIRTRDSRARFEGIGSPRMRDEGIVLWRDHTGWAAMGPLAAIPRIPKLLLQMWLAALHVARTKPDLVVLVDFGVFNVRLAQTLRERLHYAGPILYLFPPAAWLDSERTARTVSRWTVPVTAFAHQEAFYRGLGLPIRYFGHPLLGEYREHEPRAVPPRDGGVVALLPGSRKGELRYHVPVLVRALEELRRLRPNVRATVAASDARATQELAGELERAGVRNASVELGVRAALSDADAAWCASGTAVLESVLLGVPTIALYVVSRAVVWYGRRMQRRIHGGRFITLPNLVAGEEIVPEYLQDDATPEALARAMDRLLAAPQVARERLARVRTALGAGDALQRCAELAVGLAAGSEAP